MKITVELEITDQQVDDLLCGAFEGGSNYWYTIDNVTTPYKGYAHEAWRKADRGILITDNEDPAEYKGYLNRNTVKTGLALMAKEYPHQWKDFKTENFDADTSDVFLQLCVLGAVIFG